MHERRTLDIIRLGAQGDGIADVDGVPMYIAGALPGERVTADIAGQHGRLVRIERPSAERVAAPCRHFGVCGGCAGQHMSGALYRGWKTDIVTTAFRHRGIDVTLEDIVLAGAGTRRRATFTARHASGGIVLGFHEEGSHALVDLVQCPVVVPAIEAALPALRTIGAAGLATADSVRLAVTAADNGLDVLMTGEGLRLDAAQKAEIARAGANAGIVRVIAGGDIVMQSAVPKLAVGGAEVALPTGAFIQATRAAEVAIGSVLSTATKKAKRVADLFCGLGTFTFGLARGARVSAYDGDTAAIGALAAAAKGTPGLKAITAQTRDLFREPLSRTELSEFDAVVFDPPRAGAKAQAEAIARAKVPVVCAVSCSPATLARDCRILVDAGYAIERVVPVDQFTWSPQIEAVAVLRRASR